MPQVHPLPFSQRCRILAQECRARAQSFQNEQTRIPMLQLADDYERKAQQAERIEVSLRRTRERDALFLQAVEAALQNVSHSDASLVPKT
jgi:hypothetical protein